MKSVILYKISVWSDVDNIPEPAEMCPLPELLDLGEGIGWALTLPPPLKKENNNSTKFQICISKFKYIGITPGDD